MVTIGRELSPSARYLGFTPLRLLGAKPDMTFCGPNCTTSGTQYTHGIMNIFPLKFRRLSHIIQPKKRKSKVSQQGKALCAMSPDPEQQQADSHDGRPRSEKLDTNTSDGKAENLLLGIPKLLAARVVLITSFVVVMVVGLLWIFSPVIDGATEIFLPGSGGYVIEFFAVSMFVGLFHIICFVVAAAYKRSLRYLIYMLIPAGLIYVADRVLRPADMTWTDRRVASFQLGARYRVNWAGGATKVRQEALALLAKSPFVSPPKSKWPESIRALRASAVKVNKDTKLVDVEIPRRRCFFWGDQFGYLITDPNASAPVIVNDPPVIRGHNLWKIADGIYLYETWP